MPISKDYQTALSHFWSARPQTSLEHLSKVLVENPDHVDRFRFYRLWVEIVADQSDRKAMLNLLGHLSERSSMSDVTEFEYSGLRGLLALELDEIEAAKLFLHTLEDAPESVYSWELKSKFQLRFGKKKSQSMSSTNLAKAADYFGFDWQVRMSMFENVAPSKSLISKIKKIFHFSPLIPFVETLWSIKEGQFESAQKSSLELLELFPSNYIYRSLAAHVLVANRNSQQALDILEDGQTLGTEDSARDSALLGACYLKLFQESSEEAYREKAGHFLERSVAMLENSGLSTAMSKYHISILNEDMGVKIVETKNWFLKLGAAEYEKISNADSERIDSLCLNFKIAPSEGDYIFCVAKNYGRHELDSSENSRLVAIFQVTGEVSWSPTLGYEAWCQLIGRPVMSIPLNVEETDLKSTQIGQRVIQASEMDQLEEAVLQFENTLTGNDESLGDFSHSRSLKFELERIRMTS